MSASEGAQSAVDRFLDASDGKIARLTLWGRGGQRIRFTLEPDGGVTVQTGAREPVTMDASQWRDVVRQIPATDGAGSS